MTSNQRKMRVTGKIDFTNWNMEHILEPIAKAYASAIKEAFKEHDGYVGINGYKFKNLMGSINLPLDIYGNVWINFSISKGIEECIDNNDIEENVIMARELKRLARLIEAAVKMQRIAEKNQLPKE